MKEHIVKEEMILIDYLRKEFTKLSKNNIKSLLSKEMITVNNSVQTRYDYLVKKGVPFREAYKITGKIIEYCIDNNKYLETLSLDEYKKMNSRFNNEIYNAIDLNNCVVNRKVEGGPSPIIVKKRIDEVKKML